MSQSVKLDSGLSAELRDLKNPIDFRNALFTEDAEVEGIRTFLEIDKDQIKTQTIQDPTDILQANYEDRKNSDENWRKSAEWKHVARIPLAQYLEWQKLGITEDPVALLKAIEREKELKTTNRRIA